MKIVGVTSFHLLRARPVGGKIRAAQSVLSIEAPIRGARGSEGGLMEERSGTLRLAERASDFTDDGLVATVPRSEVEDAARADGYVDLWLDIERVVDGDGRRDRERLEVAVDQADLERLLEGAEGDEVALTFERAELERLLDADVEAHGFRETVAVVTVVAGLAAAGAGGAAAGVSTDSSGPVNSGPAIASEVSTGIVQDSPPIASEISSGIVQTTDPAPITSEISSGLVEEPAPIASEVSTGVVQPPAVMPSEVSTGITAEPVPAAAPEGSGFEAPAPVAAGIAGGIILIAAAGFAISAQRRRPVRPA